MDEMNNGVPAEAPEPAAQAPLPPQPPRQRRVGTFTLGLTLILIGVLVPLSLLYQEQAWTIFKFAPVVLVFLGIEVLVYAFRYREGKFKYDGLSVFLVIMLTVVSLIGSAIIPPLTATYRNSRIMNEQVSEKQDDLEDILSELGFEGDVYAMPEGDEWKYLLRNDEQAREEIPLRAGINLSWLQNEAPDREEAADAFYQIAYRVSQIEQIENLWLSYAYDDEEALHRYELSLGSSGLKNLSKESVERRLMYDKDVYNNSFEEY